MKSLFKILLLTFLLSACNSGETSSDTDSSEEQKATTEASTKVVEEKKTIVFFGNSLSAGYGVEMGVAFPGLIEKRIDSLGYDYKVINAGLSGETTASGSTRVDWVLKQTVDIFILELGGNDGLRGITTEETRKNLQDIIDKVKQKYPECLIILAGMQIPPNMGEDYTREFMKIFPEVAEKNEIPLIPFLLENVGGEPELNQDDGIHPNEAGHKIVAENVWEILRPFLMSEG